MKRFSERRGIKPIKTIIQCDSMDDDLRNSLWNAVSLFYWGQVKRYVLTSIPEKYHLFLSLWESHFKIPIDTIPDTYDIAVNNIRDYFLKSPWYAVYDLIEFIVNHYGDDDINQKFIEYCNTILERELSAYRFVDGILTPITSEKEIAEIEKALKVPIDPVQKHLHQAIQLMSDKKEPDYRNSIKESISAVEAISRIITRSEKTTLGDALDRLLTFGSIMIYWLFEDALKAEGIEQSAPKYVMVWQR